MNEERVCCPRFDSSLWDGKVFEWENRKFIKEKVFTLFYVPMNFSNAMRRVYETVEKAGANIQDGMWLSAHTSKWNMDLYVAVDREIAGAENVTLSGKFFSKVNEGGYKNTGIWMKDFEDQSKGQNISIKKTYTWYTTCPKCAKKYGKNYVAILGQIN
jgi:hypothetical protein